MADILRYLFPVPKPDSKRVVTFSNEDDCILFRHHTFERTGKEVALKVRRRLRPCGLSRHRLISLPLTPSLPCHARDRQEVGPRFHLKLFQVKLGTIEQGDAESEYVLRPYMNTAKKRKML